MQLRWALGLSIVAMLMGMQIATGATAALIFPTIKKMGVMVPAWASDVQAWMLVAGLPMQKAFTLGDWATAIGVVLVTLLVWPRRGDAANRWIVGVWIGILILGVVTVAEFVLHGQMDEILTQIQAANVAGLSSESAEQHSAFGKLHPIATGLMGVRFLLLGAIAGMMLGVLSRGTQIVAKNMAVAA